MRRCLPIAMAALVILGVASSCRAQEDISQELPPPASVEQSVTPIERSFLPRLPPPRPALFPRLREVLRTAPPFFRDTELDVNVRSYYRNRETYDHDNLEAWAAGTALSYRSGWLLDRLSIGAVLYTSQPLYAPEDRDGTLLLAPGQNGYTVLGQLYARVKVLDDLFLNLYRSAYDTPYISRDDSRMTPFTFEGYTFQGTVGGKESELALRYGGGYITKIKEHNSEDFVWMSRKAGASVDRGVALLGSLFSYDRLSIGAIDYYSEDVINIGYGEAKYVTREFAGVGVLVAAQYVDQRSVGGNFLEGFAFATHQLGIKTEASYGGGVLTLGYTRVADGADMRNPWSGNPAYTGAMIQSFNRAGEQAFVAKASYDFTRAGIPGLTFYGLFAHGWARVSPSTKAPVPNEHEVDVDVQWRPQRGFLNGAWFRARYGRAQQYQGARDVMHEIRFIVNWDFSLL